MGMNVIDYKSICKEKVIFNIIVQLSYKPSVLQFMGYKESDMTEWLNNNLTNRKPLNEQ